MFHNSSKTYTLGHSYISVRLQSGNTAKWLSGLENKWKGFVPDSPFDYSFLDSEFESLYRSEQSMGTVFAIFTFLSIFVACLGLFGLSMYTLARRTKEIGVRKVLGATVQNIVALVSKDFLKLVMISAIIAFPIAWLAMSKWLEDFAYRITIGWAVFAFASLTALLIALFTISFQADPVSEGESCYQAFAPSDLDNEYTCYGFIFIFRASLISFEEVPANNLYSPGSIIHWLVFTS